MSIYITKYTKYVANNITFNVRGESMLLVSFYLQDLNCSVYEIISIWARIERLLIDVQ